eukprot:21328-Heterococcus_DN1.PRE.5
MLCVVLFSTTDVIHTHDQQWVFVAICVCKLLAICGLCYRAYQPFYRIVLNNKLVQNHSGSRNNSLKTKSRAVSIDGKTNSRRSKASAYSAKDNSEIENEAAAGPVAATSAETPAKRGTIVLQPVLTAAAVADTATAAT